LRIILVGPTGNIGSSIARALASDGHSLSIVGRDRSRLEALLKSLGSDAGSVRCLYTADLRDVESSRRAIGSSVECLGGVDAMINSSGVWDDTDPWKISPERWFEVFTVNAISPYILSLEVSRYMRGGGTIINMGCLTATRGHRIYKGLRPSPAYLTSKVAITYLTRYLAELLAPMGIRVVTIAPSWVRKLDLSEKLAAAIEETVPLKRPAEPAEIVEVIRAILSTKTPYITGAVIEVSGGL